ncbi:spore coat polysaccharide biosynthesis predicted glycosyltransferase SpsG [Allocatelliglobosispora scoriae]|uniref:Spore coat polysaccharide biosynthesis predicted glycosyltransferase SpsG n=1 Tax=Allocatelliglobosispora scoriae TaxID=643052 RepID=A0A841BV22_9ACTN|nr:glycosyltransferase [Allocatelliglobosispora scoriae]MBB5870610.1 spore coat polysaccharide biosynthesis predicted glycosyltransferase SpsG [Allocatelliglobosispora scoriae]
MTVGIRCDAGATTGVGHLVRCVALAEELTSRGVPVLFLGDLGGIAWAEQQLTRRGLALAPGPWTPDETVAAIERHGLTRLVIDSYVVDPGCAAAARAVGVPTLAIVDGDTRGQEADLFLDQNLGASLPMVADPAAKLLGVEFALLRDDIRNRRPDVPYRAAGGPPKVLAFFGGTDAFGAAPPIAELLVASGAAWDATVIAGSETSAALLAQVKPQEGQRLSVLPTTDALPELIAAADLVISASGTSTWELLCLGAPSALVWVVENQREGYRRVVDAGLAAGIGLLDELKRLNRPSEASHVLRELLTEPDLRVEFGEKAFATVDGRGRDRVTDRLLGL